MSQLQCPNCGGYKIGTPTELNCGCVSLCFLIGGVTLFWSVPGFISVIGSPDNSFFKVILQSLFIGSALLIGGTAYLIWYWNYSRTHHICLLCGYRWEYRAGQPAPEIHVRPDLMEKGARRLEDEEHQRQEEIHRQQREKEKKEEAERRKQDKIIRDINNGKY